MSPAVSLSDGNVHLATTTSEDAPALRALRLELAVHLWWDELEDGFPMQNEPEVTRLTVHVGGEIAGMVQWSEETDPKYRHAAIDLFVGTAHQGRGVGTTTLRLIVVAADRRAPACPRPPPHHDRSGRRRRRGHRLLHQGGLHHGRRPGSSTQ